MNFSYDMQLRGDQRVYKDLTSLFEEQGIRIQNLLRTIYGESVRASLLSIIVSYVRCINL